MTLLAGSAGFDSGTCKSFFYFFFFLSFFGCYCMLLCFISSFIFICFLFLIGYRSSFFWHSASTARGSTIHVFLVFGYLCIKKNLVVTNRTRASVRPPLQFSVCEMSHLLARSPRHTKSVFNLILDIQTMVNSKLSK